MGTNEKWIFHLNVWKNFIWRMTEHWNRLSKVVVISSSLESTPNLPGCHTLQAALGEPTLAEGLE